MVCRYWPIREVFASLALWAAGMGCSPAGQDVSAPRVAATVAGSPIYVDELEQALRRRRLLIGDQDGAELDDGVHRRVVLEDLIEQRLLQREAARLKILVSTAEVNAAFARQSEGYTEDDFAGVLGEAGLNESQLRRSIRERLMFRRYLDQVVFSRLVVTDAEVDAHLAAHPELREAKPAVRLSQIVVKTSEEAESIARELRRGLSFEEAALKYSLTPEREMGGDLGMVEQGGLPPQLDEVAFALRTGSVSKVVESEYGFHLLKVAERRDAQERPDVEIRREVERKLLREKRAEAQRQHLAGLKKAAEVIVLPAGSKV